MKRREFITLLGGAAAGWPLAARAQPTERVRRIGVLMNITADDADAPTRVAAFAQGLQELGWTIGRNLRIEYRWSAGEADRIRRYAAEIAAFSPDVIIAAGGAHAAAVQRAAPAVPVVFLSVNDPVAAGLVASLAHPGGTATGFTALEFGTSAKWLELLKQTAPRVTRVTVLRPTNVGGVGQLGAIQGAAASLGVGVNPVDLRDRTEIERAITAFAQGPNGGLIVVASALGLVHRALIVELAARHKLPAIYPFRVFVSAGGLISYGPDLADQYRQTASYVDRILKGEKPADLPVQAPTKYELVINLKTAKALGLEVPATLLARADEVIE
jgi:putative tryptophan/tyrosine transport system substrate-binding protein